MERPLTDPATFDMIPLARAIANETAELTAILERLAREVAQLTAELGKGEPPKCGGSSPSS
jgi:hypothetical protein